MSSPVREPTELGEARRRVETMLGDLPGGDDQAAFREPWELRAFALAVAAHRGGHYDWPRFQARLVGAVQGWESDHDAGRADRQWHYYERWLEALEAVAADLGVDPRELDARTETLLATPRDAEHQRAWREPVAVSPAGPTRP